jgi:hypothetical protein
MLDADQINEWNHEPMTLTLLPAYGRDYPSAKHAHADWMQGKDFRLEPSGVYTSIRDLEALRRLHNVEYIAIRFKNLSRTHVIKI